MFNILKDSTEKMVRLLKHAVEEFGEQETDEKIAKAVARYQVWFAMKEHGDIIPPFDVSFVALTHVLRPSEYIQDCLTVHGKVVAQNFLNYDALGAWEAAEDSEQKHGRIQYDLIAAMKRHLIFAKKVNAHNFHQELAIRRYGIFLKLAQTENVTPPIDVDVVWHSHIACLADYLDFCKVNFGYLLTHTDKPNAGPGVERMSQLWNMELDKCVPKEIATAEEQAKNVQGADCSGSSCGDCGKGSGQGIIWLTAQKTEHGGKFWENWVPKQKAAPEMSDGGGCGNGSSCEGCAKGSGQGIIWLTAQKTEHGGKFWENWVPKQKAAPEMSDGGGCGNGSSCEGCAKGSGQGIIWLTAPKTEHGGKFWENWVPKQKEAAEMSDGDGCGNGSSCEGCAKGSGQGIIWLTAQKTEH